MSAPVCIPFLRPFLLGNTGLHVIPLPGSYIQGLGLLLHVTLQVQILSLSPQILLAISIRINLETRCDASVFSGWGPVDYGGRRVDKLSVHGIVYCSKIVMDEHLLQNFSELTLKRQFWFCTIFIVQYCRIFVS